MIQLLRMPAGIMGGIPCPECNTNIAFGDMTGEYTNIGQDLAFAEPCPACGTLLQFNTRVNCTIRALGPQPIIPQRDDQDEAVKKVEKHIENLKERGYIHETVNVGVSTSAAFTTGADPYPMGSSWADLPEGAIYQPEYKISEEEIDLPDFFDDDDEVMPKFKGRFGRKKDDVNDLF